MIHYLAAPYTGSKLETSERMRLFYRADAILMKKGVFTVSPLLKHPIVEVHDIEGTWDYWRDYSHKLIACCDAVIVLMIDGWAISTGVQAEIAHAMTLGKEVIYMEFFGPDALRTVEM